MSSKCSKAGHGISEIVMYSRNGLQPWSGLTDLWQRILLLLLVGMIAAQGYAQSEAIDRSVDYLAQSQNEDGSWSDEARGRVDTVEVFRSLLPVSSDVDPQVLNDALNFINALSATDNDKLARRLTVLTNSTVDTTGDVSSLVAAQNADGGWGLSGKKQSDPLDTMLVVDALLTAQVDNTELFESARDYLISSQQSDGSWLFADEQSPSDVARAALGLIALKDLEGAEFSNAALANAVTSTVAFLDGKHDGSGGYGQLLDTAYAYLALLRVRQPALLQPSLTVLLEAQQQNGSWDDDAYVTAIVLRALVAIQPPDLGDLPDLEMTAAGIAFDPVAPTAGEVVAVTATVFNGGTAEATNVSVEFFIGDPRLGGTPIGAAQTIASIASSGSALATVNYDTTGVLTDQQIVVFVDRNNAIRESSEVNNAAAKVLSVNADPDMAITAADITVSNETPQAFERVTITAQIQNLGGALNESFVVRFLDGTEKLADIAMTGIGAGANATAILTAGFAEGNRTVTIEIDPDDQITAETNRGNNNAGKAIVVATPPSSPPDLVVEAVTVDPKAVIDGQAVDITVSVINQGGDAAGGPLDVSLTANSAALHTFNVPDLAGGQRAVLTFQTSFTADTWDITATADSGGVIAESNETNNQKSAALTVVSTASDPDLQFSSFELSVSSIDAGEPVTLAAVIANSGTIAANNVVIRFLDGETQLEQDITFASLAGGQQANIQVEHIFEAGSRTITAVLDPTNAVSETSETNNSASAALSVRPNTGTPDLTITAADIAFSNESPEAFEELTITARVSNVGDLVAENVVVRFVLGTETLTEMTLSGVNAGRTNSAVLTTSLPEGTQTITVEVDPSGTIAESDETNNSASKQVTVAAPPVSPPDLRIESIVADPGTPIDAEAVAVVVKVINVGGTAAGGAFDVSIQDNASLLHTFNVADLGPGSRATLTLNTSFVAGSHLLTATADSGSVIAESDEANNSDSLSLSVASTATPPDLTFASFVVTPSTADVGSLVQIAAVVTNTGTTTAENVVVRLTADGAALGTDFTIASLAGGQSSTIQLTETFTAGVKQLAAVVDSANRVNESDEDNNQATAALTVNAVPRADLTIASSDISFSDTSPLPGQAIQVTASVTNAGDLNASSFKVLFTRGDPFAGGAILIEEATVAGLNAGQSTNVVVNFAVPEGAHRVFVLVDSQNEVTEAANSNNLASKVIQTRLLPDLTASVESIVVSHTDLTINPTVQVGACVDNLGPGIASNITVRLIANQVTDTLIEEKTIASISSGQCEQITSLWQPAPGPYTLRLEIDPDSSIVETDETNNSIEKSVTMIGASSLVTIYQVTDEGRFERSEFGSYEEVLVNVTIADGENSTQVRLLDDTGQIIHVARQIEDATLPAGTTEHNFSTLNRLAGDYSIEVVVTNTSGVQVESKLFPITLNPTIALFESIPIASEAIIIASDTKQQDISVKLINASNVPAVLDLAVTVSDPGDQAIFTNSSQVSLAVDDLVTAVNLGSFTQQFNTAGEYAIDLVVTSNSESVDSFTGKFTVVPSFTASVEKTVEPAVISPIGNGKVRIKIRVVPVQVGE